MLNLAIVPSRSPVTGTPADLARPRPRPVPKLRYDVEKERRDRALQAMVTDPVTDFAALDTEEFHAALRVACIGGLKNAKLAAETSRRAAELDPRGLQMILLVASDHEHWAQARAAAMTRTAQDPAAAVAALNLEVQRLGLPAVRLDEGAVDVAFTAQASLELGDGRVVEGSRRQRGSKKDARQAAALSLLAVLAGLPEPGEDVAPDPAPRASTQEIELWLDHEATRPRPDPRLIEQLLSQSRLSVPSLYLLMLVVDPDGWAAARKAAWGMLARAPQSAPGVLSLFTQGHGWPPVCYLLSGDTAVALAQDERGVVVGEPCTAASAKAAKAGAALALLAELAGDLEAAKPPARNPVAELNERAQQGVIAPPVYEFEAGGTAHQPVFTAIVTCGVLSEVHDGRTKTDAKAAAAAALVARLDEAQAVARTARTRGAAGIVARLLRAGCVLTYASRRFTLLGPDGDTLPDVRLPPPLAEGWSISLGQMLPILANCEGDWGARARRGLEAVAARRVYPALDAAGRDQWRVLGDEADPFGDDVAEELLRPPGARLVLGDRPYAGAPAMLDDPAAQWADDCAAQAEGRPRADLRLRIHPPGESGTLRAQVRGLTDHAGYRVMRKAARAWPPLRRGTEFALTGEDAAQLLGPAGGQIAAAGVTAEWPESMVTTVRAGTAITSSGGDGPAQLRWQLELDGGPLTEDEREAVAAGRALLKLRDRWVLIDAETLRRAEHPSIGELTASQALGAAITGEITVAGQQVPCRAAGRLAEIVAGLRGTVERPAVPVPAGLTATLREYQHQALDWLDRIITLGFGALLADDMGLGKTLTVIAFHLFHDAGPTLVVCPASLLVNWEREFARFAPGVPVRRYHGSGRSLDDVGPREVVITSYGTMLRDAGPLAAARWSMVVADEAQQVKNERSGAARAVRAIPADVRLAVTGTPVENSMSELWAILDWINPGLFGTLAAFRESFRQDQARLSRLIAPFMLRRRKTDPVIAAELPGKVLTDRVVQLTTEQAGLYRAVTEEVLGQVKASTGIARNGHVLRLLQALQQICNGPAHYLRTPASDWDADRQAARSGKLAALDELLESLSEPALLFTGYVWMGHQLQAHLAARGITTGFLHGGTPATRRQELADAFQAGHGDVLIVSVRAAGVGLNLTRARHVIHFDRPWNPAVEDQATDRAHRIGQRDTVHVHHLITEGTVEDRIAELLVRKRELAESVLGAGERALTSLDDDELRALVSLGGTS